VHCGPIAQEICIFWHDPASLQSTPVVHAVHLPFEQTSPASPQGVPSLTGPVAMHCIPPSHPIAPRWHASAGVHGDDDRHGRPPSVTSAAPLSTTSSAPPSKTPLSPGTVVWSSTFAS
jgi:hypothetical protein